MVQARQRVVGQGFFDPLAATLVELVDHTEGVILEVGAGPAHLLAGLLHERPRAVGLALDSSKAAAKAAARAHDRIASVACDATERLPVRDGAVEAILCAFAPRNPAEFRRVLHDRGQLIVVHPGDGHLHQLREALDLLDIASDKAAVLADQLGRHFTLEQRATVEDAPILDADTITDVVMMGPNAFHRRREDVAARAARLGPTRVTTSVVVGSWRVSASTAP